MQTFGTSFEVRSGAGHLVPSVQTTPRSSATPLAP